MTVTINGTTGVSGVAGSASTPALIGSDADSGYYINSANEPNASVNGTAVWNAASTFGFKNRIINGGMQVNQRGGTISASATVNTYGIDRFAMRTTLGSAVVSMQQSTVAPANFYNSLLCTVTTAASSLAADDLTALFQRIEGVNVADLGWGTASAQPVTLSFQVRSSVTGTYGVGVQNDAGNRSYPSTYTINAANTWETKTITIPGDTSGTWNLGTTSTALYVFFSLGAGSNYTGGTTNAWNAADRRGASGQVNWCATLSNTFYITGVQLEKGSTATSFDYRPYGTELQLCQRYFCIFNGSASSAGLLNQALWTATTAYGVLPFPVTMRATPTGSYSALADFTTYVATVSRTPTAIAIYPTNGTTGVWGSEISMDYSTGWTGGQAGWTRINKAAGYISYSAEL